MRSEIVLPLIVLFITLTLIAPTAHCEDDSEGFHCEGDCNYCDSLSRTFDCTPFDDQCTDGNPTYSEAKEVWYSSGTESQLISYDPKNYLETMSKFTDYKTKLYFYYCEDGCDNLCKIAAMTEGSSSVKDCQPWQTCIDDNANKKVTCTDRCGYSSSLDHFPSGDPEGHYYHDGSFLTRYFTGCPGGEDGSTGCLCEDELCKGWCMDNAPVYDGFAGCSDQSQNYKDMQDSNPDEAFCEVKLGGECGGSGKQLFISRGVGTNMCPAGVKCTIDESKTCSDIGGTCMEVDSSIPWYKRTSLSVNNWQYCNQPLLDYGDYPNRYSWKISVVKNGGVVKGSLCPDGEYCCVPVEEQASDEEDFIYNEKYTMIADPRDSPTSVGKTYRCESVTGSSDHSSCIGERDAYLNSKQACYCNYLAIKDFYECEDTVIDDSHPCASGNCAADFAGGQSFCCPTEQISNVQDDGVVISPGMESWSDFTSTVSYCAHVEIPDSPTLCWDSSDSTWKDCKQVLGTDGYESLNEDSSVGCYRHGTEILYGGLKLKCDNGKWTNSQSCGETIFNYKLESETEKIPLYTEISHPCDNHRADHYYKYYNLCNGVNTPKSSFSNAPLSYSIIFDRPRDAIAYVIPQPSADDEIQIKASKISHSMQGYEQYEDNGNSPFSDYIYELSENKEEVPAVPESNGKQKLELKEATGSYEISFAGKPTENVYNITVDCYTPDKTFCYSESPDCYPNSFCVEDSPSTLSSPGEKTCQTYKMVTYRLSGYTSGKPGFYETDTSIKNDTCFYCCPKGQCAHATGPTNIECYPEGQNDLNGCMWMCKNGVWGKGGVGNAECLHDCDCNLPGTSDYTCSPTLIDESKSICCFNGQCALENSCVGNGYTAMRKGSLYVCREGAWEGSGIRIKSSYETAVLSKKNPEKDITLSVTKSDINPGERVKIKVYHYFQTGNFGGSLEIRMTESPVGALDYEGIALESIELPLSGSGYETTVPFIYKAKITADISSDSEYLIYSGSVLVMEVTS
ncbi:MAG: hypothetical protein JW727_06320 [Candidatus Aenigmarchaeota archaeon]|nr:hypothetical protein [Candidatus Aenigmarchaeota archaeon]